MVPARQPAIDLDQLAVQVTQIASSQQLAVVPAAPIPKSGLYHLVLLDNNHLSAADFCELAAIAGAALLYVQADAFDAKTDPDLDVGAGDNSESDRTAGDRLTELRRDAERFNGRICQLELAFVVGCVLHCWAVTADWHNSLVERVAELLGPGDPRDMAPLRQDG